MDKSPMVLDIPLNELLWGMGQEGLPDKEGVITLREIWSQRHSMSYEMVFKIEAVMEVFRGISLEGLYDLKKRYSQDALTQDEKSKITAIKATMMVF